MGLISFFSRSCWDAKCSACLFAFFNVCSLCVFIRFNRRRSPESAWETLTSYADAKTLSLFTWVAHIQIDIFIKT